MPSIQHATDILVRVVAAGVNPGDCQNRAFGAPSYAAGDGQSAFSILGMALATGNHCRGLHGLLKRMPMRNTTKSPSMSAV